MEAFFCKQRPSLLFAAFLILAVLGSAAPCHGATYYVDALDGADSQSGDAPGAAWKTLDRVSKAALAPGDTVLFRRGCVWRELFRLRASGAPGRAIVFGAYGKGPKPSFRASDLYNDPGRWFKRSENLWYAISVPRDPVVFVHDGMLGARQMQRFDLAAQWDYYYDATRRRLFVYSEKNPAEMAKTLELGAREFVLAPQSASYIQFDNIDFRHAYGVAWVGWGARGVTFRQCSFSQSGLNHIQFNNGSADGMVVGCTFDDWNVADSLSYAIQAIQKGSGPIDILDCTFRATRAGGGDDHTAIMNDENSWIRTVRGCVFQGMGGNLADDGIVIWHLARQADAVTIEDNVLTDMGGIGITIQDLEVHGASATIVVRRNLIQQTNLRDDEDKEALRLRLFTAKSDVTVSQNLILGTLQGRHPHQGIGAKKAEGAKIYNNLVVGAENGLSLEEFSTGFDVRNNLFVRNRVSGLRAALGSSAKTADYNNVFGNGERDYDGFQPGPHDLHEDPRLGSGYRPGPDSPCIDAGTDVGLTRDIVGQPVPRGTQPDIGPFEIQ